MISIPRRIELACFGVFCFLATLCIWFRWNLFGFDSYAHLNLVCFGFNSSLFNQPVANMVFSLLPCNLFIINLFMLVLFAFSLFGVFLLVEHFFGSRLAWVSSFLLISLSPMVLFGFFEFENELLAYPFIIWGIYFLLTNKKLFSLICFCYSLLFWKWVYYFTFLQGNSLIIELNLFHGLLDLWFLLPFLFFIPFLKKINPKLMMWGLIAVVFLLWNSKLFVFVLPFLGLAIAQAITTIKSSNSKLFLIEKVRNNTKYIALLAVFCLVGWNITYLISSPTQKDWKTIQIGIKESQDKNLPLYANLSYDYWTTNQLKKEVFPHQIIYTKKLLIPHVLITSEDLNCTLISNLDEYPKLRRVYQCD